MRGRVDPMHRGLSGGCCDEKGRNALEMLASVVGLSLLCCDDVCLFLFFSRRRKQPSPYQGLSRGSATLS